ncbi:MAG: BTAD domain-containing putative transcriptional regulator, partial [Trueperaceae bacterium]
MSVEVRLLGAPRVRADGRWVPVPQDKRGALLVYLAHEADWVSRERLGFLFWPDVPDATARRNLRQLLTRLKALPPPFAPEIDSKHLRWRVATDVSWFRQALEAGDAERAVALAAGAYCEGFSVADASGWHGWLEQTRDDLDEAWRDAALSLVAAHARKDRHADAAALAKRVWERRPLDDEALNAYLAAAHSAGQRDAALTAFTAFERSLERELGLLPLAETLALVDAIRNEAPRAASTAPNRVVAPRGGTRFVGRHRELAEIDGWLEEPDCRLVVVVGMGGVGKTRLARELARRRKDAYRHGATVVALGASEAPGAMAPAIADAIGLKLAPGRDAVSQLGDHFRPRRALLVVDDLERPERDAEVLVDLLEQAPNLQVVVTSREELDVPQVWTFRLTGLRVHASPANPFDASEAVQFFLQAAARGNRRLRIDDDERAAVLEVCRLTEGLPLALELAGAWAKHLNVREIADELRQDVSVLMRSPDARDEAGMRAVFERSWRLLSPEQQRTLASLSVFRGGFDRRAAEQVADAGLYLVLSLVSKSLVAKEASGRFGLHEIVRAYAGEKLAANPDAQAAAKLRHATYFLGLLEGMPPGQDGAPQDGAPQDAAPQDAAPQYLAPQYLAPQHLAADAGNLRRAWRTLCENGDQDGLARGLPGLVRLLEGRSAFEEGVASLTSAREVAAGALAAELDAHRGGFLLRLG